MFYTVDLSADWRFASKNRTFKGNTDLPSSNYTCLLDGGYIKDPFFGANEADLRWVSEIDWIYEKEFSVDKNILSQEVVRLVFENVDTVADIYLNGNLLRTVKNAHHPHVLDVKGMLNEGKNKLSVYFHSPVRYVTEKQKKRPMPPNMAGINGFSHVRKPAYHFGWDWGPVLPPSGLEGKVKLQYGSGPRLDGIRVEQGFCKDKATLTITVSAEFASAETDIKCSLFSPSGEKVSECKAAPFSENCKTIDFTATAVIENPELWYANGMSPGRVAQPLYTLRAEIAGSDGVIDEKTVRIGLRDIKLLQDSDGSGRDFCFSVNGNRVFAKGANWIPSDSFISRTSSEKLKSYIKNIAASNFNMLRIWGGGYYASDTLLDLCDRYGILIWQDFQFACAPYPFDDKEFLDSVKEEAVYNIKRMRTHACLALWCGNNEIEMISPAWTGMIKLKAANRYFFYKTLPDIVRAMTNTAYWPGSPGSGEYLKRVNSDSYGDTHLWGVWHGMKPFSYYYKRKTRFCSEFGFESLPPFDTVKSFTRDKKDYGLHTPVMKAHQKCPSGNDRILYYMIKNYRIPKDFPHLIYLSQLTQAESIAFAVEHWRRNMGRCNGALYWQLNDCWPVSSWSSIDYYGNYKALQYFAKEFFRPVQPSILIKNNIASLYIVNDSLSNFEGSLRIRIVGFNGEMLFSGSETVSIPAYASKRIKDINLKTTVKNSFRKTAVIAELYGKDGEILSAVSSLLVKERKANLKKPAISVNVEEGGGVYKITAASDTYARRAMFCCEGLKAPFDKNFFDMEAGKVYTLTLPKDCGLTKEELSARLSVISFADTEPAYPAWKEALIKTRIALMPVNFFGRLIHSFT